MAKVHVHRTHYVVMFNVAALDPELKNLGPLDVNPTLKVVAV